MRQRLIFLDGMRGVAAFAVMYLHAAAIMQLDVPPTNAGLAVDFFFCLSGFVVAHAYDNKVVRLGFWRFISRRFVRLYPMIFFGVTLGTVLAIYKNSQNIGATSTAAFLLFPISLITGSALAYPVNFPMWSLFFEIFANIAYGLERMRVPIRWLIWSLASVALLLVAMTSISHVQNLGVGGRLHFLAGFVRVSYPFLFGFLLHRLCIYKKSPPFPPMILACALLIALLLPVQSKLYDMVAVMVIMPLLVFLGASAETKFGSSIWAMLGRLSYPVYLVHVPILEFTKILLPEWPSEMAAALGCLLTLIVSYAALRVFDEPLRHWLGQLAADSEAKRLAVSDRAVVVSSSNNARSRDL